MYFETECEMAVQGHPRSLVSVLIESAHATSYVNSNLGPVLPRFRDTAGFLLRRATSFLFHPNFFGIFPLEKIAYVGPARSEDLS